MTSHHYRDEEFKLLPDLDYEPFTTREEIKSANFAFPPRTNDSMAPTATKTSKPKKDLTQLLPPDFVPSSYSVVLGRGKGSYNFVGNQRCRVIVNSFLGEYEKCDSRRTRGQVVGKVLNIIKEACPVGAFIKMKDGRYYSVDEKVAREKIFTMFRDCQTSQGRRSISMSGSTRASRRLSSSSRSASSAPPRLTMSTEDQELLDLPDLITGNLEALHDSSHSKTFDDEYNGTIPLTDIFNDDLIGQVNLLDDDDDEEDNYLDTLGASFHDVGSCDLFSI